MLIGVVAVYLLGTLILGAAFSARIRRVSDYLVAGRNLGLALTTASLAAVQIGAGVVLGGAETGASSGIWPGTWYGPPGARQRSAFRGSGSGQRSRWPRACRTMPARRRTVSACKGGATHAS